MVMLCSMWQDHGFTGTINHSFAMCLDCEHVQCASSSFHTKASVLRNTKSLGPTEALHDRSENNTITFFCFGPVCRVYSAMLTEFSKIPTSARYSEVQVQWLQCVQGIVKVGKTLATIRAVGWMGTACSMYTYFITVLCELADVISSQRCFDPLYGSCRLYSL